MRTFAVAWRSCARWTSKADGLAAIWRSRDSADCRQTVPPSHARPSQLNGVQCSARQTRRARRFVVGSRPPLSSQHDLGQLTSRKRISRRARWTSARASSRPWTVAGPAIRANRHRCARFTLGTSVKRKRWLVGLWHDSFAPSTRNGLSSNARMAAGRFSLCNAWITLNRHACSRAVPFCALHHGIMCFACSYNADAAPALE
jgi:hypothetical protein